MVAAESVDISVHLDVLLWPELQGGSFEESEMEGEEKPVIAHS